MTKQECAIISAFTGVNMLKGDDLKYLYNYVSELIGRPVFTHEMGIIGSERLKDLSRSDFIDLCRTATDGEKKEKDEKKPSTDIAQADNEPEEKIAGLTNKVVFDEAYFIDGRLFCLDKYEVKMPTTKDGKWVQIRKKSRTPIMVTGVVNNGCDLRFYDMYERTERKIPVSQYYHGYYRFVEAAITTEGETND